MSVEPVLIAGAWRAARATTNFRAVDPLSGKPGRDEYPVSARADIDAALEAGAAAADALGLGPAARRPAPRRLGSPRRIPSWKVRRPGRRLLWLACPPHPRRSHRRPPRPPARLAHRRPRARSLRALAPCHRSSARRWRAAGAGRRRTTTALATAMASAPTPTVAPRRYRPRSHTNDLQEIVEDHLEEMVRVWDKRFASNHGPLHPRVRDLLERSVRCGNPHFGFLRLRCVNEECDAKGEKIVPFSCKSRGVCPSCGQKRAIAWAERMVEEVLPDVPYVQLVFTIPKMLRMGFLFERKLYGELCRAAYAATRKFFEAPACAAERTNRPSLEKAVPAFVAAPQSFGSLVNFHPHCHAVCSLGVFTRDGVFHPVPEDLDFAALEEIFRDEAFRAFLKCEAVTEERVTLLRSWRHSGFGVDASRRVAQGDRAELESVRKSHRPSGRALRARLRGQPSGPTASRCPALPGVRRSPARVSPAGLAEAPGVSR